ncbi:palmitoyltransferase for Vac8p [Coemansia erecta]|uniref:Palmitoyltransferase n=1 Tax=Coemansia asiatica TaxID=1052880 RepID=A0A9W7XPH6_9FUNG|nr:palmitoyltransferase for Vac8p [Coemansia asiatica]KAJ2857790.1 palmitoyltransferase for Vac8p [Coemansia erecta]
MKFKYLSTWDRRKVYKSLGFIPVGLTLGLLAWSLKANLTSVMPLIKDKSSTVVTALWFLTLVALWVLTLWSYFVCVFRNPGNPRAVSAMGAHGSTITNGPYIRVSSRTPDYTSQQQQQQQQQPAEPSASGVQGRATPRRRCADDISSNNDNDSDDSDASIYDSESESSSESGDPLTDEQLRQSELLYAITVKENGQPRYCIKCNVPKPDRAHHCSICGICVLKMDHHCPWLNNCVGFFTHKAFILFLAYSTLYCTFTFISTLVFFIRLMSMPLSDEFVYLEMIILMILSGPFSICLCGFIGYHIYLLVRNATTLESYESNTFKVSGEAGCSRSNKVNLFDVGAKKNFFQVFGTSKLHWFVPTATTVGDGIRFPISFESYNELRRTHS